MEINLSGIIEITGQCRGEALSEADNIKKYIVYFY